MTFATTSKPLNGKPELAARELTGTWDHRRFYDPETGTIIGGLTSGEVVKGGPVEESSLEPGVTYKFLGRWTNHPKYGAQFEFSAAMMDVPLERDGILVYLEKVAVGVGEVRAVALWEAYESAAIATLRIAPERVAFDGIMPLEAAQEAAKSLQANFADEKANVELFQLFDGLGFPSKLIGQVKAKWGRERAAAFIRQDPFKLITNHFYGCGFIKCDRLYLRLKRDPRRLKRQMLAAWYAIHSDSSGNTWHKVNEVKRAVIRCVGLKEARADDALELATRTKWLAIRTDAGGNRWVAEWAQADAESRVAVAVAMLASGWDKVINNVKIGDLRRVPVLWPTQADLSEVSFGDRRLSQHQLWTINLQSPVAILGGTPGTGKTFSAAAIIKWVAERYGADQIRVCAPTGKAAVRITEVLRGYGLTSIKATTIHRLLKIGPQGDSLYNWLNPLPCRFLFVDEVSMLDISLAAKLLPALATGSHVLLIGDVNQLAPVGGGAPLRDLISSRVPSIGTLTEIQRNSGMIVQACARIKDGLDFETTDTIDLNADAGLNLKLIETRDAAHSLDVVQRLFAGIKSFDPIWEAQCLVNRNVKGEVSRVALNGIMQSILNPATDKNSDFIDADGVTQTVRSHEYRRRDKIMCLRNVWLPLYAFDEFSANGRGTGHVGSYSAIDGMPPDIVCNGELGCVLAISNTAIVVRFDAPERICMIPVKVKKDGAEQLEGNGDGEGSPQADAPAGGGKDFCLAYAATVHKFQGSEIPLAVCVIDDGAGPVACRELIYTGISRAKRLCILVGKRATLLKQIRRVSLPMRKTFLRELLVGG